MNRIQFDLPAPVMTALSRLQAAGHEAYLVGGCVRDLLLSLSPKDWDVCTSAHPDVVKSLFRNSIDTGIRHGTVTVLLPVHTEAPASHHFPIEMTTWRAESGYSDHRHPDVVRFSSDLRTDLSRRDFTINAMAWNPGTGLVDFFGGQDDLAAGVVRCVGDPLHRFQEDALRMLRAIRFCSQLGFAMDADTAKAIRHHRDDILHVSPERIQYEMTRTLLGKAPSQALQWWETGLHACLFPPLLAGADQPAPSSRPFLALEALRKSEPSFPFTDAQPPTNAPDAATMAWALLFLSGELAGDTDRLIQWMRQYRFPNRRAAGIRKLLSLYQDPSPPTARNLCYQSLGAGRTWVFAKLILGSLLGGTLAPIAPMPEVPTRLPDGATLQRAFSGRPDPFLSGPAFGALLACVHMALCEKPSLQQDDLMEQIARTMWDAWPATHS